MSNTFSQSQTQKFIALAALLGLITTLSTYAGFGVSDHIEQLPIIHRFMDSGYLQSDFFTNEASQSIARYHYSLFMARLANQPQRLPYVFLASTLLVNIVISGATFLIARELFNKSDMVGAFAASLTMTISTFYLGWSSVIYKTLMTPSAMATPFIFLALFFALRKHLWRTLLSIAIAVFFHPLFGLETGFLIFAAAFVADVFVEEGRRRAMLKKYAIPVLLLGGMALLLILPQLSQEKIDPQLFIYIVAHFRHPHHYIPSSFKDKDYLYAGSFLLAFFLMWRRWQKDNDNRRKTLFILILSFLILALNIGGYVFVELFPSRIWTEAQTFRLLYLVKWLGLILAAGTITNLCQKNKKSWFAVYFFGVLHPLSLGVAEAFHTASDTTSSFNSRPQELFYPALASLIIVAILFFSLVFTKLTILFTAYILLIILIDRISEKKALVGISALAVLLIVGVSAPVQAWMPAPIAAVSHYFSGDLTNAIPKDLGRYGNEVTQFAQANTPPESIFLTPPDWGAFRLLASRAIVVDFKAFPFTDSGILGWYERMIACYGKPERLGFEMIPEMRTHYEKISDEDLLTLRQRYHFQYAVLYHNTPTKFSSIFENSEFKIIIFDVP